MAFLASSFVVFVVQERTNGAKHVQFVSGVDPFSYWTASWMWDLINFTLPCISIIILFACFDVPAYTGILLNCSPGAGCMKGGWRYPPNSDFFSQTVVKMPEINAIKLVISNL